MNALILAAILATGQQCPGGSCIKYSDPPVRSTVQTGAPKGWENIVVRVGHKQGATYGLGSGTIMGSDANGRELVLTAHHVTEASPSGLFVDYQGERYPAKYLSRYSDGDLEAIDVDLPGTFQAIPVAETTPKAATMFGYGSGSTLMASTGPWVTSRSRRTSDRGTDDTYQFHTPQGSSGGGVFNQDGQFVGVVWGSMNGQSWVTSTRKVNVFLTQFQAPSTPGARGRFFKLNILGFKGARWDNAPQVAQSEPVQPVTPPAQPVTPPTVVQGQQGPAGKDGQPGKDAPAVDLSPILSRLDNLEANQTKLATILTNLQTTTAATAALVQKPITFLDPQPDGSEQARAVGLGGTIRLSIPQPAVNHIQQNATPKPPTPNR